MTSTTSTLNRRLISGNGKVYTYQGQNYYAYAYPTAYAYSYPLRFAVFVTVSVNSQGYPVIRFYFSYGGQTVNYDTVTLKVPVASAVYQVEGYSLLPSGLYADAEFVTGGPGGGSSAAPLAYNATYQLFYLSAGKLTPVPHAYDYGADTAETVYNTADAGYTSPTPHAVLTVGNEYFHDLR